MKNEGLKEVKRYPEALVSSPPLKNRKVEGLFGFENQILYEIKTNGLSSLKKELVDPSEESRNSIASSMQENLIKNNFLQRFFVDFDEKTNKEEKGK